MFQSRNRGSFGFVIEVSISFEVLLVFQEFQSRNRGSFGFKAQLTSRYDPEAIARFNLVIEVLLISRQRVEFQNPLHEFQSRNRGSFDFKDPKCVGNSMFQSRNRGSFNFKLKNANLKGADFSEFQSRNRGSFGFKALTSRMT